MDCVCNVQVRFDDEVNSSHKGQLTLLLNHFRLHPCELCFPVNTRGQIEKLVSAALQQQLTSQVQQVLFRLQCKLMPGFVPVVRA